MRLFKKNGCKRLHSFFLDLCKKNHSRYGYFY